MTSGSDISTSLSATLPRAHDLDAVAGAQHGVTPCRARHDRPVERHGDATLRGIDGLLCHQRLDGGESASGSLSPLMQMVASAIALLRRARRQKALKTERADSQFDHVVEDQLCHGIRSHRRQQYAVAMVASGIEQIVERRTRPRIGASSRLPGRWPTQISSIGNSSIAGTARHAASRSVSMPPAVIVSSNPFSSTVPPDDQAAVVPRHEGEHRPAPRARD